LLNKKLDSPSVKIIERACMLDTNTVEITPTWGNIQLVATDTSTNHPLALHVALNNNCYTTENERIKRSLI